MTELALGIDLGTSGIRSAVVNAEGRVLSTARAAYPDTRADMVDAESWWIGAADCIARQVAALRTAGHDPRTIARICVDGTSGSMVLTDETLTPVTQALFYSSGGFHREAAAIAEVAPKSHITQGSASALARALSLVGSDREGHATHLLHQADFVAARLMGRGGLSDANNALKTGFDPGGWAWPNWIDRTGLPTHLLPEVRAPGAALRPVASQIAARFGLSKDAIIHAGTTDSIAAFVAAAPLEVGAAVTSLGTTLAIKVLSDRRIDAPEIGLYSHRLGPGWLVGGASNSGGGALLAHFSREDIARLSQSIDPEPPSGLDYYPLPRNGERFPVNDPDLVSRTTPRPESDAAFLKGLLEGIARIEADGYAAIARLGGPSPRSILTAGGGAQNTTWARIRSRVIGCPVIAAQQTEAAVGVARLALNFETNRDQGISR